MVGLESLCGWSFGELMKVRIVEVKIRAEDYFGCCCYYIGVVM